MSLDADIATSVQSSPLPALVLVESWAAVTRTASLLESSLPSIPVIKCTGDTSTDALRVVTSKSPAVLVTIVPHVVDRVSKKQLRRSHFKSVILVEINEILARGFRDHIQEFLKDPSDDTTVTLITSSSLTTESLAIKKFLKHPNVLGPTSGLQHGPLTLSGVNSYFINYKHHGWKVKKLLELLKTNADEPTVIICNSRRTVERLAEEFEQVGIQANTVHADMNMRDRKDVVTMFLSGITQYLIVTELAFNSVSQDIQNSLILNYDMPLNKEKYISRVGVATRTFGDGGGGTGGKTVINFTVDADDGLLREIERHCGVKIEEMFSNVSV